MRRNVIQEIKFKMFKRVNDEKWNQREIVCVTQKNRWNSMNVLTYSYNMRCGKIRVKMQMKSDDRRKLRPNERKRKRKEWEKKRILKSLKQRILCETNKQYSENSYGNNNIESIYSWSSTNCHVASPHVVHYMVNPMKSSNYHWSDSILERLNMTECVSLKNKFR